MPISFYAEDGNCVFLRLEGNMSIKKVLGELYLDHPVRRTSIWGVSGTKLKPFL
jgi:hypothetical protein